MVGKYVDYSPVSGSFTSEGRYNGYGDQAFSTNTVAQWRILFVNNNILTIMAKNPTNTNFYLQGENGYNNGVLLLNNACKAMYSNSNLGATGRSLNIDDVEKNMTYNKNSYSNYGQEYSPKYTGYPNIFADELTGAPNGIYGSKYDLSEQDNYITGKTSGSSFKGKWTYYTFEILASTMKNQIYVELFSGSSGAWLASRCVNFLNSNYAYFRMFYISGGTLNATKVDASYLCISDNSTTNDRYSACPVVEIDLSKVYVGETGTGDVNDAYSIVAR